MTRPRWARALLASLMALLLAPLAVAQPLAAMPQAAGQMQSRTVGSVTIDYSPDWEYESDLSDATSAFLSNSTLPGVLYLYGEIANAAATDPDLALEQFGAGFFSEFGEQDERLLDRSTVTGEPSTAWHLYAVTQSGIPYGMLITGNTTKVPGSVVASILLSPVDSFGQAVRAAQDGISINGAGSPFASFDGAQLVATLAGGASGTTPTGGLTLPPLGGATTPEDGTDPTGGLTLPPLNPVTTPAAGTTTPGGATAGQASTVVVSGVTLTYSTPWTYEDSISTPDEIAYFSHESGQTTLFGYASTDSASADAQASLATFNDGFFSSFGATGVQQVAMETLPSGHAWSLNTGDKNGTAIALLALADVTTDPTRFRVQVVIAPVSEFATALPDAQATIRVDGQGALGELDVATVLALLGTGTTPPGGLTLPPLNPVTTPAAGPTTGGTTPGHTMTVAGAAITYNDRWILDTVNSEADSATFWDAADGSLAWFGYLPASTVAAGDATAQLTTFNSQYFQSGFTNVQQRTLEAISTTGAWALTTAELNGIPVAVISYADTSTGQLRVQMLMAERGSVQQYLPDIQRSIQVDGVGAFAGVDPARVMALLGSMVTIAGPARVAA